MDSFDNFKPMFVTFPDKYKYLFFLLSVTDQMFSNFQIECRYPKYTQVECCFHNLSLFSS